MISKIWRNWGSKKSFHNFVMDYFATFLWNKMIEKGLMKEFLFGASYPQLLSQIELKLFTLHIWFLRRLATIFYGSLWDFFVECDDRKRTNEGISVWSSTSSIALSSWAEIIYIAHMVSKKISVLYKKTKIEGSWVLAKINFEWDFPWVSRQL